ncbi:MAG: acetyl-CoA decarbonylase/synthase complex subunit gamma [Desulfovibrionaceae bacterium]
MALTGLQIHKLLPKTNCKECGSNTCLAFAMKLAQKKAELAACPYASDEAKEILGAASEPPIRGLALGPEQCLRLGEETVLYRHEKTFVNPTALGVNVNDTDDPADIDRKLNGIKDYELVRLGDTLALDMVAVTNLGSDDDAFLDLCWKAYEVTGRPVVMRSKNVELLARAAAKVKGCHGLIHAARSTDDLAALVPAARDNGHGLALCASGLDSLHQLSTAAREMDFTELALDLPGRTLAERVQSNVVAQRAALRGECKPLGHPHVCFVDVPGPDGAARTVTEIAKYGGALILPDFDPAELAALLTLRLNIFTDPQKPIQVEPDVYPIAEPGPDAPVFVTTNFSLTYFLVSAEIENAGLSAWLAVPDAEGMSVLTAWAAGKFSGTSVAKFLMDSGVGDKLERKRVVLPGYVAVIKGELEEGLSDDWEVLVGPQEAADLEGFAASLKS